MESTFTPGSIPHIKREYPYFGHFRNEECDFVVLFTKPGEGIVVHADVPTEARNVGDWSKYWHEDSFTYIPSGTVSITL